MADLDALDDHLASMEVDGYLIDASGSDPDQRYLTGFASADPFISLVTAGELHLLVRGLDRGLARAESTADTVVGPDELEKSRLYDEYGPREGYVRVIRQLLNSHDVSSVAVPPRFPLARADDLRDLGVTVVPDHEGAVGTLREVKSDSELEEIERVQRATETAMQRAESLLTGADITDGILHDDGSPLTSEHVKEEIGITLLKHGCRDEETIVACGPDAGDPHHRGAGPIHAGEPIVIDIFPRDVDSHYHADMTRTFCVGTASGQLQEWYEITCRAQEAAFDRIAAGTAGADIHEAVCDVYEDAGIQTQRSDPGTTVGFVHGTGHGVGLSVHEGPTVSSGGGTLEPGNVITIEPGVYDPNVGGVRIEDLVVVTEDGYDNLTEYERTFIL